MNPITKTSLNPLDLLTNTNLFIRVLSNWSIGLILFFAAWGASYLWLPEGSLRFASTNPVISTAAQTVLAEALRIFAWNLLVATGLIVFSSLFVVGRFPASYLLPWIICIVYGALLGTNSFAFPDPAGPTAPTLAILWTRAGLREITAYLLIAAALANIYLWQQPSWWSLQVNRVRTLKEVHLFRAEVFCLILAIGFLFWAAYVEAWQIIHF